MNRLFRRKGCIAALEIFFTFSVFVLLHGCASIVGYERIYAGPPKPLSQIAILTHPNPYSQRLLIFKIDGQKAFLPGVAELSPGRHTVTASFTVSKGSTRISSKRASDIQFTAQAGHVYTIYPAIYTHQDRWYPAVLDITGELCAPQYADLTVKIDNILLKNRGMASAPVKALALTPNPGVLKGFGEKVTANLKSWVGKDLFVTYVFDRYRPYITAKAADKAQYHLQIDQATGEVINVYGRTIDVGKTMQVIWAYQPLGSVYAYNKVSPAAEMEEILSRIYEERNDGSFKLIKERWWARHEDQHYSALLPVELTDGLPKEAIRALALAFNTKQSVLAENNHIRSEIQGLSKDEAAFVLESKAIMIGRDAKIKLEMVLAKADSTSQARIGKAIADCDRIVQSNLFGSKPPLSYNSVKVNFFPTGYEMCPYNKRIYQSTLPRSRTTFVGWELNLALLAPGQRLEYQIKAFWFNPDGTLLAHQTANAVCEATWSKPWRAMAWGYQNPGNWEAGTYTVEFYINGKMAAAEQFTIQ